jgi:WS/DGAT/MGAT family acyltransferase
VIPGDRPTPTGFIAYDARYRSSLAVMPQLHLDRLTAVDASFLHQERGASHMHVGAVTVFDGPPPPFAQVQDSIRERLHLVPRYRQKLEFPRLESGRPLWVDDPAFTLEYHIRHVALPKPGGPDLLRELTARIFSQRLDRSKPLWEMWVVEGLQDDRFALVFKTHHALIDGVSGMDLAAVLLDLTPEGQAVEHPDQPWEPQPLPGTAEVLATGALGGLRALMTGATRAAAALTHPSEIAREARVAAEGVSELVWAGMNPAPPTPLNVPIGPHRRYVVVHERLADFKLVKDAFGGTVNDVVLAVVSGALREWLRSRGVRTEGLELRALVPVSTRGEHERGQLGNRITAMRGPLPVYIEDPLTRLRTVKAAMDGIKESKQAVGAELIAGVQGFAPPTILAQASRLNFSTRLFNLIVTNVPGPQFPLYLLGRRLRELQPVAFLPEEHALAVAIMSYDGALTFGLLADYDAVPDVDGIADGIAASLAELVALAKKARGAGR